ncbi:hypothetical protein GE09DRAFT_1280811 [Coniochaeta sp. 2T2.1]|nr:hypothetical protein GE09DRAFT_1280811 [Coniochaeta sp. 2T2.1]
MDKIFGRGDNDRDERDDRLQQSDHGSGRQESGGVQDFIGQAQQYLSGGNATHGGGYPAGAGVPRDDDDDYRGAAESASRQAGDSGDASFFSSILGSLTEKKRQVANEDIDEDEAVQSHRSFFGSSTPPQTATPKSMGSAAAMQALKLFSSGQAGGKSQSQGQFIALAMAEASKLFDQQASQGKVAEGSSKNSAVMQAGEMALKMYLKSQAGASGASGSGGASGLLGFASKFM